MTFLKLLNFFKAEKATSTLTLSYEELKHIRSALSRHKLESLCDPDLKAEIEKGSVCFHCYKTKFSLFFNRKQQCQLCLRNICSRCISKVRFLNKARLLLLKATDKLRKFIFVIHSVWTTSTFVMDLKDKLCLNYV